MSLEEILLSVTIALLVVLAALFIRDSRVRTVEAPASQLEIPGSGNSLARGGLLVSQDDSHPLPLDSVVVVPLPNQASDSDARALVMGPEDALEALDRSGLSERATNGDPGYIPKLARRGMAFGGQQAGRVAQGGIDSGRIVKLSEESAKHLKKGKPVYDRADNLLGIVKGDKGKIKHVVRFDKAGAQAVVASNAATLAVTAALSAQLESIEQQLQEISETLDTLVKERDREKLAKIVAVNSDLEEIARDVRRRGMTATDMDRLHHSALPAETARLEGVMNAFEAARGHDARESRRARVERIDKLIENERLEYWLEYWVLGELARTRFDLLKLVWEQQEHPETAPEAARRTQEAIKQRQESMHRLGETLDDLADPSARLWRDHIQLISRFKLKRRDETVHVLLEAHGDKLLSSSDDPLEVTIPERSPATLTP